MRLLRGEGRYSDDVNVPGQAYAAMVRSSHAHARIRAIDGAAALAMPGVLAVLTGADFLADGLKPIPHVPMPTSPPDILLQNRDGSPPFVPPHWPLPADRARFVGEAVAMVVAETAALAREAADRVNVAYDVLPAIASAEAALAADAVPLYDGHGDNVAIDGDVGDCAATDAAFAKAAHVVRLKTWVQRVTGVPMEPRSAVAAYDPATGRTWVHAGSGGIVRQKRELAGVLGVNEAMVRFTADEIGGNFGTRNAFYPEFALVAWAAKRFGRPVKWTAERSEAFASDHQGRDLLVEAELALDHEGKFLAVRSTNTANLGAHCLYFVPLIKGAELMSTVYRVPAAHVRARAVLSTTPPTTPYRSAGRPEVVFAMERLVDLAAQKLGIDRLELRRRNLVPQAAMPYRNPLGMTYDSGTYAAAMEKALELADWEGFPQRRAEARVHGRLRGIGVGVYVEASSGAPRERTEITVDPQGRIDVVIGTMPSGQGHETSFAQLVTEWLGVPNADVRLICNDTDVVQAGGGSHSGRSMRMAGLVMDIAVKEIVRKGRTMAAQLLEAAEADVSFSHARFRVTGTDRSVHLYAVARAAPLAAVADETVRIAAFPFGAHVCELEVDPETGAIEVVRYSAVDDVGRAVNPLILEGQAHGGIVQGLGQALTEGCVYDPASGQLLTGSFMDYAMPRAGDVPCFATALSEVPSTTHPLGMRAGGEGGTTPALGAVINALVDALAEFGVSHVEMPATPERTWRAIRTARKA